MTVGTKNGVTPERGGIISSTSKASTKFLHGGLRYLEYGKILLVREALAELGWWLNVAPHLTKIIKLILPFYADSPRPIWKIKIGMKMKTEIKLKVKY